MVKGLLFCDKETGNPIGYILSSELGEDVEYYFSGPAREYLQSLLEEVRKGRLSMSPKILDLLKRFEKDFGVHKILIVGEGLPDGEWETPDRRYGIIVRNIGNAGVRNGCYVIFLDEEDIPETILHKMKQKISEERYRLNIRRSVNISDGMIEITNSSLLEEALEDLYRSIGGQLR